MSPLEPNLKIEYLFSVKGLNVLITGGGGDGLGAMMTRALVQNGANKVFILGRRQEALEQTVKSCAKLGAADGVVVPVQCDVTSQESLVKAAEQVASQVEYLDVLVVNSGVMGAASSVGGSEKPTIKQIADKWMSVPMQDFTQVSNVNVTGAFYTVAAFAPLLQKANDLRPPPSEVPRPQVIVVTSIAGYSRAVAASMAYSVSKAGAEHLSKLLSTALTPHKIRVNSLVPGPFMSEMTYGSYKDHSETRGLKEGDKAVTFVPLERAGGEEDIAGSILYMCSRAGGFLSGCSIILDGGRLTVLPSSY